MANAGIDNNGRNTLIALSSLNDGSIVDLWADPVTHRLLVDLAGGSGTVTSVSVVTANGFAGTVATATTTPAITMQTTINAPILAGNGTALSAATTTGSGTTAVLATSPTLTTPVLNGTVTGTGVSQSVSASTLVQRDANSNAFSNDFVVSSTSTATAGGTTTLTVASTAVQVFTGSSNQTLVLPDATTLTNGKRFWVNNNSSGTITINANGGGLVYTAPAGGYAQVNLISNGTAAGTWDVHPLAPSTVTWGSGTTGLVFNTALTTTATILAGASSSTVPVFIPQRGASTTGFGGDGTNLYGTIAGTQRITIAAAGITVNGTVNKVTITAPATGSTLTIADGKTLTANNSLTLAGTDGKSLTLTNGLTVSGNDGTISFGAASKTLTVNNSLTLAGTDATTMTFPSTSATIARTDAAQTFTGTQTYSNAVIYTNNAITASGNAATVPVTAKLNTVTNNSAATLTITMTTASAVDGQMTIVRILDATAAAQTITWVNTENSTVTAPTTSNGSTTLPLTVGFMYNGNTSKWRCIASA